MGSEDGLEYIRTSCKRIMEQSKKSAVDTAKEDLQAEIHYMRISRAAKSRGQGGWGSKQ